MLSRGAAVEARTNGLTPLRSAQLVFLSSTALDLRVYRDALASRLERSRFFRCVRHENSGPADMTAVEFCRDAVHSSDIYVGLIGLRRGFEPDGRQSITEMEFDWAGERGIPRMVWLTPDHFALEGSQREPDALWQRQQGFRARIRQTVIVATGGFDAAAQLALEVENHLLADLIAKQHAGSGRTSGNTFVETQLASAIEQAAANQNLNLNDIAGNPEGFDPYELLDRIERRTFDLETRLRANRDLYPSLRGELAACYREMAALASINAPDSALFLYERAVMHGPDHVPARLGYGDWLRWIGRPGDAEKQYRLAAHQARAMRQTPLEAHAYHCHALLKQGQGHFKAAQRSFERLIPFYQRARDLVSLAEVYDALGIILQHQGELARAEELFKKAESIFQRTKRDDLLTGAYVPDCESYIAKAFALAEENRLQLELPAILRIKANLAHRTGDSKQAIILLERALDLQRSQKAFHEVASAAADLASIYVDLKEFDIAEILLKQTLAESETLEINEPKMRIFKYLGDLEAGRNNRKLMCSYYRKSLEVAKKLKNNNFIKELEDNITRNCLKQWFR